jgi:hypothetical protein
VCPRSWGKARTGRFRQQRARRAPKAHQVLRARRDPARPLRRQRMYRLAQRPYIALPAPICVPPGRRSAALPDRSASRSEDAHGPYADGSVSPGDCAGAAHETGRTDISVAIGQPSSVSAPDLPPLSRIPLVFHVDLPSIGVRLIHRRTPRRLQQAGKTLWAENLTEQSEGTYNDSADYEARDNLARGRGSVIVMLKPPFAPS